MDDPQMRRDSFYWQHGQCCAGCDWWESANSIVGACKRSAPVSSRERWAMLDMTGCSLDAGAGHIMTKREHHCGDFKDEFDWSSLPAVYLRRIGAPTTQDPTP